MNYSEPISNVEVAKQQVPKSFSKLSKLEKLEFITNHYFKNSAESEKVLKGFWHQNPEVQKILDEFSENTISNFTIPFGVLPQLVIDEKTYFVPMAIEESSVVAAASKSAKYWRTRGGVKAEILGVEKIGQVHFQWTGEKSKLENLFNENKAELITRIKPFTANMEKRGGGLLDLKLLDKTNLESHYYQLMASFNTCDAMGANFINTVLENLGKELQLLVNEKMKGEGQLKIIMAILSNYTPDCTVKVQVDAPVEDLAEKSLGMEAHEFAEKFQMALKIAELDPYRATTHNKGIFNGIDAVVLATGNDFRATEACGHAYAARSGQYRSLSKCRIENGHFYFELEIPLALGTVGGLTALHPMSKLALEMMGNPGAEELMKIIASVGLMQNFGAVRSLVTTGIQKGHMKMHLMNILNHMGATEEERENAQTFFEDKVISYNEVGKFLESQRKYQ